MLWLLSILFFLDHDGNPVFEESLYSISFFV